MEASTIWKGEYNTVRKEGHLGLRVYNMCNNVAPQQYSGDLLFVIKVIALLLLCSQKSPYWLQ